MNLKKDRRQIKRTVNHLRKKAGWGKFVIDCRGHPSRVTAVEFYTNDLYGNGIDCVSLLDGTGWCCSLLNCSPTPISEEKARSIKEPVDWVKTWNQYYHE